MKLHFGNLAKIITDAELKDLVVPFGAPSSVEIVRDSAGASKGFGFVNFEDADHARAAMTALNGKEVSGQALRVSEAKPRKGETVLTEARN
jgi:RNA-binding proteins (RRM domain)